MLSSPLVAGTEHETNVLPDSVTVKSLTTQTGQPMTELEEKEMGN